MTKIASNAWIYSEFGVGVNNSKCPTKSVIEGYGCTISAESYQDSQLVPQDYIMYESGGEINWVNTNYTGIIGSFVIFKGLLLTDQLDYYVNNSSYFMLTSATAGTTKTYPYLTGYTPVTSGFPRTTRIEPDDGGQIITIVTTSGDTARFYFIKGGSSTCNIPDSAFDSNLN